MVPCGVPEVTLDQLDLVPLRITHCLRPVRKCLSQACKQPSIPLLSTSAGAAREEQCRMPWPGQGKPRQLGETNYVI